MNFIRSLNSEHFIFLKTEFSHSADLLRGWKLATNAKFKHNISKIVTARKNPTRTSGVNATSWTLQIIPLFFSH